MIKQKLYIFSFILFLIATAASAQVTFTDVTNAVGLGDVGTSYLAATWGDYDNDGDADLLIIGATGSGLYRNEGDGGFVDVTQTVGITDTSIGGSAAIFVDFDNDGALDLFAGGGLSTGDFLYRNNGDGTFIDVSQAAGMESKARYYDGAISFDYDNDGLLDIYVANWGFSNPFPNFLYHNEGSGRFKEIATQIGLDKPYFSSGIALGDYDDDGDLDLFITAFAYREIEMVLYRNDGGGAFIDVAQEAGLQRKNEPSNAFFWDYDNDGDLDLFVEAVEFTDADDINILYRNNGDGTFTDVTQSAGIALVPQSGSGAYYGDYDNDGWLDLCVTYDNLPILLYHNNGDGTFTEVSKEVGIRGTNSGTTSFVDYDNDGDLDIFISPWIGAGATLYRNDGTTNHWLGLKLVGAQSNRDAIGAWVKVITGNLSMLREIAGSSGIGSQQDRLPLHFGLAGSPQADVIEIRWPSRRIQTFTNIPAAQRLTIDELEGLLVVIHGVFPVFDNPAGGTPAQIQGEHFLPGSRVIFGGVEASNVRVASPSLITAVTPPGAVGPVDVEVIHPDGKRGILKDGFQYTTLRVTRITPESGPVTGGITVQIEGFGFQVGAQVQIAGKFLATPFVTPTLIRGMLPSGASGVVDVSVTNPDGERDVLPRAFTYISPPIVERVRLNIFVPLRGGGDIVIKGSGFIRTPTVQIGGIAARSVEFTSSSELNVHTPQILAVGPQDVVIINPDGQRDTLPDGVTVLAPPKIKSVEPNSGGLAGGTKITIVGEPTVEVGGRSYPSRFVERVDVFIGDVEIGDTRSVIVQSDHIITVITPPNTPGPKDVTVVNPDGEDDTLENAFIYNPLPQIRKVIPDNGRLAGGTVITIHGGGFLPGAEALFSIDEGGFIMAKSVKVVSPTTITAITPSNEPGTKDVVVKNPDRQTVTLPGGFTYNPMPKITDISPDNGPVSGGTKIIIRGTGFLQRAKVFIGKRAGTTEVRDDFTIEAVTPANPQGVFDVRVINPDTQVAIKRKGFISVGEMAYNFPNPFRAEQGTTFRYVTNERVESIKVQIFNMRGVPIGVVGRSGSNEVRWDDSSVHVGLYVYLMEVKVEGGKVKRFQNVLEVYK